MGTRLGSDPWELGPRVTRSASPGGSQLLMANMPGSPAAMAVTELARKLDESVISRADLGI